MPYERLSYHRRVAIDDERLERLRRAMADQSFDSRLDLFEEAGRGGMGIVYRAIERATGRVLAVKVLREGVWDHARFAREVTLLERLSHPAIVQYAHHGVTVDGRAYFAMQWLDGESLAVRLRSGRLPIADALAIGSRIASALAHAHAQDILHRDLKPSNVLLVGGDPARATLIDFGVAKDLKATTETRTGQLIGTPAYMAPEQATGRVLDARADLFSLGCLLYECVVGEPPFVGGELVEVLAQVLLQSPLPVGSRRADVPVRVDVVIRALLEKQPELRIGDAAVVAEELTAIATALAKRDEAVLAVPNAAFRDYEPAAYRKRNRRGLSTRVLGIASAGVIALIAVVAVRRFEPRARREMPKHADEFAWLYPNQWLLPGQAIRSHDGATSLVHELDGNVALYHDDRLLWATGTSGRATALLSMQTDGNLVLYSTAGVALWNSETYGRAVTGLAVQNDCNVVIYDNTLAIWNTATFGCVAR